MAIPVLGGGGRLAGLQGFLPAQSSAAPQFSEKRFSERIVEQIVDIPAPGGGLQGFRAGQSTSSSTHDPPRVSEALDEPGEGVFRTFLRPKKVRSWVRTRGPNCAESSPSTRRAYVVPMVPEVYEPVLEVDSEEEDPDQWKDEFSWLRSELFPGRWYLLGTGLDVNIIWEESGQGS